MVWLPLCPLATPGASKSYSGARIARTYPQGADMDQGRWSVTAVLHTGELDGLVDPIKVEDLGDDYGIYELTRSDAALVFGSKSAPTE